MAEVYEIINITNGKRYVGSTVKDNINDRWSAHKSRLSIGLHNNPHLQHAWDKYGKDKFIFVPILLCDKNKTLYYEQVLLDNFDWDYNIAKSASAPMLGISPSEETRDKIRVANTGSKNGMYGKTRTYAVKEASRKANQGSGSGKAKLREQDVILIRELYLTLRYTQRELGEMFGVANSTISQIVNRKRWKHI